MKSKAPDPPPKPIPPEPDECCGSGCVPCVYDLYEEALERWKAKYERLHEQHATLDRDAGRP